MKRLFISWFLVKLLKGNPIVHLYSEAKLESPYNLETYGRQKMPATGGSQENSDTGLRVMVPSGQLLTSSQWNIKFMVKEISKLVLLWI